MSNRRRFMTIALLTIVATLGLKHVHGIEPLTAKDASKEGDALFQNGEIDAAIAAYTEALRLDPKSAQYRGNRAHAYFSKGEYDKALSDCTEAIRLEPKVAVYRRNRGLVHTAKGEYDEALEDLNEAIRSAPESVDAYNHRGNAYLSKGEPKKALADYDVAIRLKPGDESAVKGREEAAIALRLAPDPSVDEQLFMLRHLEFLHSRLPTGFDDRERVARELASVRHAIIRGKEYAQAKEMEQRLVTMYSDSIEMVDRYVELLADSDVINREFYRKAAHKTATEGVDSLTEGFGLGSGLAIAGVEPITATVVIGGYAIKKGIDNYQEQKHLDEQQASALARRTNQYLNERSRLLGRIEVQAGVLAEKLKWGAAEVGFDQDEAESKKVSAAIEQGNLKFFIDRSEQLKKARPRDPFVCADSAKLCAVMAAHFLDTDQDELAAAFRLEAVQDYLRTVQLIPSGRFHDPLRAQYIWNAAQNAQLILYHTPKKDDFAIHLADAALKLQPRDPDGKIRLTKAYALARNDRFDESLALFEQCAAIRGSDADTLYDSACLLSLADKPKESLSSLKSAWAKGIRSVRQMRRNRDLTNLRSQQNAAFSEIVTSKLGCAIDFGFVWNTLTVTNNSEFPLTNLALKATWKGTDGAEYVEVYWADFIPVGGKHDFQGANRLASMSREKNKSYVMSCEETRSVIRVSTSDVKGTYEGLATYMRQDGSDTFATDKFRLEVSDAGEGAVGLGVSGSGFAINLKTANLSDGCAAADSEDGAKQRVHVFFDEEATTGLAAIRKTTQRLKTQTAYGWCQSPGDAESGLIRAFWVEKTKAEDDHKAPPKQRENATAEVVAAGEKEITNSIGSVEKTKAEDDHDAPPKKQENVTAKNATGGEKQITNSISMKLTLVPSGEFMMGSGESAKDTVAFINKTYGGDVIEADLFKEEHPQHRVRITKPFYLGTYHVTRGQFRRFVADTGHKTDAEKGEKLGAWGWNPDKNGFGFNEKYSWRNAGFEQTDEHPVVNVSWNDAVAFCNWLSKKEGKTYRLPTEAEWEYACRAGITTRYWSGDDPETLAEVGNVADATLKTKFPDRRYTTKASDRFVFTAPVGSFKPNAFGLYDMHGNAWQWCGDWYGKDYYSASPVDDPTGPDSGNARVPRGGSWISGPYLARSANRDGAAPGDRCDDTGFRVCLVPEELIRSVSTPMIAARADPARDAYERGKAAMEKNNWDEAITTFTEAIRLAPKDAQSYLRRGEAYTAKGELDQAIADFTEAIHIKPDDADGYDSRGVAFQFMGEPAKAITDFTEAIRLKPKNPAAILRIRGWAYAQTGELDKGITDLTEAIRLDPNNADAYGSRGVVYSVKHGHDKAIEDFTEAIKLNPKDAKAYFGRGASRHVKGQYNKAIDDFTEAIRIDPKDAGKYTSRGVSHLAKGELDDAIADCTEAIRLAPKFADAYEFRGVAYEKAGETSKAEEDHKRAKELGYKSQ